MCGDIASGLYDIHKKNFIHADIKPDNILVDYNFTAKIADLGIIKNTNKPPGAVTTTIDFIGSSTHLPNEFFIGPSLYTKRVDVFSFGLCVYFIFTCTDHQWAPNASPSPQRILLLPRLPAIPLTFVQILVAQAVHADPAQRKDIFFYKWLFRKYCGCAEKMLGKSRRYRRASVVEKNRRLVKASRRLLKKVAVSATNLEAEFLDVGISYNDLNELRSRARDSVAVQVKTTLPVFAQAAATRQNRIQELDDEDSDSDDSDDFDGNRKSQTCVLM
jgi:serine/threonine protein kinase